MATKKKSSPRPAPKKKSKRVAPRGNTTKKPSGTQKAGAKQASKRFGPRADLGAPIDGFFAKQPAALRPIVDELRALVQAAAPDAVSSLKWGMPFFTIGGEVMCAIGAHKAHVNLILSGPPGTYSDPDGLLEAEGKTGRHLKLTSHAELPKRHVAAWLRTAAALARKNAKP